MDEQQQNRCRIEVNQALTTLKRCMYELSERDFTLIKIQMQLLYTRGIRDGMKYMNDKNERA